MDGKELKRYHEVMGQMQFYRAQAYHLEGELRAVRPQLYRADQKIDRLEQRLEKVTTENAVLRKKLADLTGQLDQRPKPVPAFVKPNVPGRGRKRPGRQAGHEAAHRPLPERIDRHVEVPVPRDAQGRPSCPHCHTQLSDVRQHQRIVEDIVPSKVVATCYHTTSGYCPGCRKYIESRAPEQPPAADVPHGQVGLNALATAALLRVQYRLPYQLTTQLLADLPGLTLSPGAVAKQVQRMSRWLEGEYDRLGVFLRFAPAVHMDKTSWRVDGHNHWLWTLLDPNHTLFHIDKSRGHKVVVKLLGEVFGGTLVSDFYSAYAVMDGRKQKCLTHLLRELRDTAAQNPAFALCSFRRRLKRLVQELLLLKKQKPKMPAAAYTARGRHLERRLKQLAQGPYDEPHPQRIAARLRKHEGELTAFLWDDAVDGTNNAAERALRPAVVLRKITGGSRSQRGARATAVLMSVLRTARQQQRPLFETIRTLLMNAWAGKNPGLLTDVLADTS
jgi:transposase-like protein